MYKEKDSTGNIYREKYIKSMQKMIEDLQKMADEKRRLHFESMKNNPEKHRTEFKKMLGWPLTEYDDNIPNVMQELVVSENSMEIYRLTICLPIGIEFYGMLFKHNDKEKLPLVITQHGGMGTPEFCSGLLEGGSSNYNDMVMRIFNKGVNVFAPQLLLWDKERYPVEYDRTNIDAMLKQLGSSITAVEVYGIMKSIDYLSTLNFVDEKSIGMVGLSYGGFYTLFTAATDTRIKASIACSQYNNRYKYSWTDWTWSNSANTFMDNEIACLIYPRYLGLYVGKNDELFECKLAEAEAHKIKYMIDDSGWFDFYAFEGTHEFIKDDVYIDKFLNVFIS